MLIAMTAVCLLIGMGAWLINAVSGPIFSKERLDALKAGMTENEVRELLGEPNAVYENSDPKYANGATWIYERSMNPGWVEISFDHNHRFSRFNDESVFPAR